MASIMIVDDSFISRRNLRTILTQAGHNVVAEAINGLQAISEYDRFQPDLVTMDVTMPVMDGTEAVKQILTAHPEAKIVMVSAMSQKPMVLTAIENGAKHYIIKPITSDKVVDVIQSVLAGDKPVAPKFRFNY